MKNTLLCLLTLNLCAGVFAQTVKTYAGMQYTGSGSYTGYRNNHKDSVLFSAPMGIEVDTAGRLYVSNEHNIFWIQGNTAFLAAGYTLDPSDAGAADSKDAAGSVARFSRPVGMAINPNTNEMMICDQDNNQIRKMEKYINNSTQQIVTTFAGVKLLNGAFQDGAKASAKFNGPVGIAVAANGDMYVADRNNHVIRKISGGNVTTIAGLSGTSGNANGTGSAARFAAPYNVCIDGNDLLVADYGNSAVRKINLSTFAVTDLITSGLFGPKDLCKVGSVLYIAEGLCVKRYESGLLSLYVGSNSQQGYVNADGSSARFSDITGIVYHPKLNMLYVVDNGNNVVRSISPNARPVCRFTVSTTAATKGQTVILTSTSANSPKTFKWTINPSSYTLLNNTKLTDSVVYLSFSQIGTYSVKLWVSNQSGADSLLKSNHIVISAVTAPPVVDFSASKTNPITNEVISLVDLSTNTPTSWKWRISPGQFIWMNGTDSTSKIPNVKFTNGNNFTITLIASNAEGSNSLTKVNYIKVNGSSINSLSNSSVFVAYPNPANNVLAINAFVKGSVQVMDAFGRVIETIEVEEGVNEINTSNYNNGAYFIQFINENGIYSERIIVNHN
jgi:PKD repeat protein